ncbi:acetate--CoA ligase family protein [Microbacterium sp. X-17]|uniref:acetate--CoA ligase family protein n=1 Tax=Microbacterium sp. X-17 TaxID=3144404 RepID=UPI0031F4F88D
MSTEVSRDISTDTWAILDRGLAPRAVAVYGASDRRLQSQAARIARQLTAHGYERRVALVNPRSQVVDGIATVTHAADSSLARELDFAVISVPREQVATAVDDCVAAGIRLAIVTSAGFGEADEEGRRYEDDLRSRASASGLRLFGPNCMGLINFTSRLHAANPPVELPRRAGHISVFGQSGWISTQLMELLSASGQGLDLWVTMGNAIDIDMPTMLEYAAQRPETSVVVLYLESVPEPDRLRDALLAVRRAGKEVIVLKSGRSEEGRLVAASHTGAMSSPDMFFDVLIRETDCIRVDTIREAAQAASLVAAIGRPRGPFAVVGSSGGDCVLAADTCSSIGLPLAALGASTQAEMRRILPQVSVRNPADVTPFAKEGRTEAELLSVIARDPDVGCLILLDGQWRRIDNVAVPPEDIHAFVSSMGLEAPMIEITRASAEHRDALAGAGVALGLDDEVIWRMLRRLVESTPQRPAAAATETPSPGRPPAVLPELEAFEVLRANGIPVVESVPVTSEAEALETARRLGFPVVVKGLLPGVTHKALLDLVETNLVDEDQLVGSWSRVSRILEEHGGGTVVIQPQETGGLAELIIGTTNDPLYGPHLVLGAGGRWAEDGADRAWVRLPVTPESARRALSDFPLGRRLLGHAAAHRAVDAIVGAACTIGEIAVARQDEIQDIEVNPFIVTSTGIIAVDAVVTLATGHERPEEKGSKNG